MNKEIKEKVLKEIGDWNRMGESFTDHRKRLVDLTIQEKDAEFSKEKDKWMEERGRMAELLFKKGINKW